MPAVTYLVTYRNGSGHKTLRAEDYMVTGNGHLKVQDEQGEGHIFSAGADWHIKDLPDQEAGA